MKLYHFSSSLPAHGGTVDPKKLGANPWSTAEKRVLSIPRAFFYTHPKHREALFTKDSPLFVAEVPDDKVYDFDKDEHSIKRPGTTLSHMIAKVLRRGYQGVMYFDGKVVAMFKPVTVKPQKVRLSRIPEIQQMVNCPLCEGLGTEKWEDGSEGRCNTCGGRGRVTEKQAARYTPIKGVTKGTKIFKDAEGSVKLARSIVYVSPSEREGSTMDQAAAAFGSPEHRALLTDAEQLGGRAIPAMGTWIDGAEESAAISADRGLAAKVAAILGKKYRQKGVAIFHPGDGSDTLDLIYLKGHDPITADKALKDVGIQFATHVPVKGGVLVHVIGADENAVRSLNSKYKRLNGTAEFPGADTRDDAAKVFDKMLLSRDEPDWGDRLRQRMAEDYDQHDDVTPATGFIDSDGRGIQMGPGDRYEDHRAVVPTVEEMEKYGWPEDVIRHAKEHTRTPGMYEAMKRSRLVRFHLGNGYMRVEWKHDRLTHRQRQAIKDAALTYRPKTVELYGPNDEPEESGWEDLRLSRDDGPEGWITPEGVFHQNDMDIPFGSRHEATLMAHDLKHGEAIRAGWMHVASPDDVQVLGHHPDLSYTAPQLRTLKKLAVQSNRTPAITSKSNGVYTTRELKLNREFDELDGWISPEGQWFPNGETTHVRAAQALMTSRHGVTYYTQSPEHEAYDRGYMHVANGHDGTLYGHHPKREYTAAQLRKLKQLTTEGSLSKAAITSYRNGRLDIRELKLSRDDVASLKDLVAQAPGDPQAHLMLAEALEAHGHPRLAGLLTHPKGRWSTYPWSSSYRHGIRDYSTGFRKTKGTLVHPLIEGVRIYPGGYRGTRHIELLFHHAPGLAYTVHSYPIREYKSAEDEMVKLSRRELSGWVSPTGEFTENTGESTHGDTAYILLTQKHGHPEDVRNVEQLLHREGYMHVRDGEDGILYGHHPDRQYQASQLLTLKRLARDHGFTKAAVTNTVNGKMGTRELKLNREVGSGLWRAFRSDPTDDLRKGALLDYLDEYEPALAPLIRNMTIYGGSSRYRSGWLPRKDQTVGIGVHTNDHGTSHSDYRHRSFTGRHPDLGTLLVHLNRRRGKYAQSKEESHRGRQYKPMVEWAVSHEIGATSHLSVSELKDLMRHLHNRVNLSMEKPEQTWPWIDAADHMVYPFQVDGRQFLVEISKPKPGTPGAIHGFKFRDERGNTGVTGKGSANRVFAHVAHAFKTFAEKHATHPIGFDAEGSPGRLKLYRRFANLIPQHLPGWEVETLQDSDSMAKGSWIARKKVNLSMEKPEHLGEPSPEDKRWEESIQFTVPGSGTYDVALSKPLYKRRDLVFDRVDKDGPPPKNPNKVFAHVVHGALQLLRKHDKHDVEIEAGTTGLVRLYERFMKHLPAHLPGWTVSNYKDKDGGYAKWILSPPTLKLGALRRREGYNGWVDPEGQFYLNPENGKADHEFGAQRIVPNGQNLPWASDHLEDQGWMKVWAWEHEPAVIYGHHPKYQYNSAQLSALKRLARKGGFTSVSITTRVNGSPGTRELKLARQKAPAGGVIVNNQFFKGGKFLPRALQSIRKMRGHIELARVPLPEGAFGQKTLTDAQIRDIENHHGLEEHERLPRTVNPDGTVSTSIEHLAPFFDRLARKAIGPEKHAAILADDGVSDDVKFYHLLTHAHDSANDYLSSVARSGTEWYGSSVAQLDRGLKFIFGRERPGDPNSKPDPKKWTSAHAKLFKMLLALTSYNTAPINNTKNAVAALLAGYRHGPHAPFENIPDANYESLAKYKDLPPPGTAIADRLKWQEKYGEKNPGYMSAPVRLANGKVVGLVNMDSTVRWLVPGFDKTNTKPGLIPITDETGALRPKTWGSMGVDRVRKFKEFISRAGSYQKAARILEREWTPAQLKQMFNLKTINRGDLEPGAKIPGSFAFGPKFGAFFQNLRGEKSRITMDKWYSRTMARLVGNLIGNGKLVEVPEGPRTRRLWKRVGEAVAKRLGISPADMQAVLWYYEQNLWRLFGAKNRSEDFADGIRETLKHHGFAK